MLFLGDFAKCRHHFIITKRGPDNESLIPECQRHKYLSHKAFQFPLCLVRVLVREERRVGRDVLLRAGVVLRLRFRTFIPQSQFQQTIALH